jgi:hypothetical protein
VLHCFLISVELYWFTKLILVVLLLYKSSRKLQKKCVAVSCTVAVLQVFLVKDDMIFINALMKCNGSAGRFVL